MGVIENALEPIVGNFISICRDTLNGWYFIEFGIPNGWVYDDNEEIKCDVIDETDVGKIIKLSPKHKGISIDDLVIFIEIIISTNNKIADKEKEFTDRMDHMKSTLENEAKKFYEELDEIRNISFKHINDNFVKQLKSEGDVNKPRIKKSKSTTKTIDTPSVPSDPSSDNVN